MRCRRGNPGEAQHCRGSWRALKLLSNSTCKVKRRAGAHLYHGVLCFWGSETHSTTARTVFFLSQTPCLGGRLGLIYAPQKQYTTAGMELLLGGSLGIFLATFLGYFKTPVEWEQALAPFWSLGQGRTAGSWEAFVQHKTMAWEWWSLQITDQLLSLANICGPHSTHTALNQLEIKPFSLH